MKQNKIPLSNSLSLVLRPNLLQCFVDYWFIIILFLASIYVGIFVKMEYANLIGGIGCLITCIFLVHCLLYYMCYTITVTTEQIIEKKGIFGWQKEHIELFRVNDYDESVNWRELLLGLKTVHITSTDKSRPHLYIIGLPRKFDLISILRERVNHCKNENNIFESGNR